MSLNRFAVIFFALAVACILFFRLTSYHYTYWHPDEVITVKVVEHVLDVGKPDTNWANADLDQHFKYTQYNFSAYNLFASGVILFLNYLPMENVDVLAGLRLTSGILAVVMALMAGLTARRLFGPSVAIMSTLLVLINPLLYQDSLYARPEVFLSLLFIGYFYLIFASNLAKYKRFILASILLGLMVSTKISMVIFSPLLFLLDGGSSFSGNITQYIADRIKFTLINIPCGIAFFLLGFVVGLPYILFDIDGFLNGFNYLSNQYNGGHWPHGLRDGASWERFGFSLNYFIQILNPFYFLFFTFGVIELFRERRYGIFFSLLLVIFFFIWFSLYKTFFERNFSHIFTVTSIITAYGIFRIVALLERIFRREINRPVTRKMCFLLPFFVIMVGSSLPAAKIRFMELPKNYAEELQLARLDVEEKYGLSIQKMGYAKDLSLAKAEGYCTPKLFEVVDFSDRYSAMAISDFLVHSGFSEVARHDSPYQDIGPSTLQTYFTPTYRFLFRPVKLELCDEGVVAVTKREVGDLIGLVSIQNDSTWTPQGAYGSRDDMFGSNQFYGSWSGSDSGVGKIQLQLQLPVENSFVLPVKTGPVTNNLSIRILDAHTKNVIFEHTISREMKEWALLLLKNTGSSETIIVEASDSGSGWGEWLAVGLPRESFAKE